VSEVASAAAAEAEDLAAPLYVAWQITNECNLACLHCIEESGPGKAFADELDREVPYLSFSGGEPMLHPHFFAMVERACSRGAQLKIETNAHYLDPANAARLKELGVKAVQVSLDGASTATFGRMRVRGEFDKVLDGIRNLRDAGVPIEINFSPAKFNLHEIGNVVDLAYELGAYSFYTGRTMYTGNAVKAWRHLEVTDEQYDEYFDALRAKTIEYRGRMRVHFHEAGLLEELRYRVRHPAALLIVLPNGLVKLINALPFGCGDFRRDTLDQIWANFRRAWRDPRVAGFVDELAADPARPRGRHQGIPVGAARRSNARRARSRSPTARGCRPA
jgi:MoaA/NifB/PqqE/SkfB family radical SAM enzyme